MRHPVIQLSLSLSTLLLVQSMTAQQCSGGSIEGQVIDPTGAVIAGATVDTNSSLQSVSDGHGHYELHCLHSGSLKISTHVEGFEPTAETLKIQSNSTLHHDLHLALAHVETEVAVSEESPDIASESRHTLDRRQIEELSDDPDDMKRELQILAAANGSAPGQARITVDGFTDSGNLPPKASIARIVTTPDLFSSEYDTPPYAGGRIEIFTKPGADTLHGALFFTGSDSSLNARNPLSLSQTPAGRQRYGFEVGGPVKPTRSDYFIAFERRNIDEFTAIHAIVLNSAGSTESFNQTVATPQHLWTASARSDNQITPSDQLIFSFAGTQNKLGNQGVGGQTLLSSGYDVTSSDYSLRLSNLQTVSINLLHELHLSWRWQKSALTPFSSEPEINVAGYFVAGGSAAQKQISLTHTLEADDTLLWSHKKHTLKAGLQSLTQFFNNDQPTLFNGAWTFAGTNAAVLDAQGSPTTATAWITPLEQYRRALLNLTGGTPTTYHVASGEAKVSMAQTQVELFGQEEYRLHRRVILSGGVRYAIQTEPLSAFNAAPRTGLSWALDKHSKTVLHLHLGMFYSIVPPSLALEAKRLDGVHQTERMIYSPFYSNLSQITPESVQILEAHTLSSGLAQTPSLQSGIGIEHDFPHHWHVQSNLYTGESWKGVRSRNINAPLVASQQSLTLAQALAAPRPLIANQNIFRTEDTGHLSGHAFFIALDQHSYKTFSFFLGYLNFNFHNDTAGSEGFAQSAYSNQGESGRPDWQTSQRVFLYGMLKLPKSLALSGMLDASSGQPWNAITGSDNNGDGVFNDRPSWDNGTDANSYHTAFGRMSIDKTNGTAPRNIGTLPAQYHLNLNLSRSWTLEHGMRGHPWTTTLNLRGTNIGNHTNVTGVSTVASSPEFAQPTSAESARRTEFGVRVSF